MVGNKNPLPTLHFIYNKWGRQQKHVTHPTSNLIYNKWGRQQKHVTGPLHQILFILSIAINCAFKIFVQNLFCVILECKIYFALFWSAKFILRYFGVQNLFCVILECKIYFARA